MNDTIVFKGLNNKHPYVPSDILPKMEEGTFPKYLTIDEENNLVWKCIDNNLNYKSLYIKDNRIGIGREPLYKYKFDIALAENTVETGMHIGDGKYGFSLGNGSKTGFIPQILGMSRNTDESALYFVGRTGDADLDKSEIPIITFDCRNIYNTNMLNRPLLGIKINGQKTYKMLLDEKGILHVNDIFIDGKSIFDIFVKQKNK